MHIIKFISVILLAAACSQIMAAEVFFDDFEGDDLKEHWEVINPDPDAFIVEEGSLLILSNGNTDPIATGNTPNILKLTNELPSGNWVLSTSFTADFQTEQEAVFLGLYTDNKTYVIVQPRAFHCGNWGNRLCVTVETIKMSKGKPTTFSKRLVWEQGFENFVFDEAAATISQPIEMRIAKEGRKYRAGIQWKVTNAKTKVTTEKWIDLPKFTILRQKGKPAVGIYQVNRNQGETVVNFDWVKLEAAAE
ncbi:hypothetical protein [Solemya velum gill symbiont]|nr:hypothetical protein [Solemya velum gill symbiont]OOY34621.1 hypothetical protein BOV88_09210 [Solemya velum gill symbiont]OOY37413.1 hypothetical protein BOV89_07640 [Solemya velum gill symbiont]OOY51590.1 hypothetical protein BOV94_04900 [Solemya velum gill symbiont]OOY64286.1 hypothetical protein BOW05_09745 [Solemya velum gill symbiont]OOZ26901.1 hypothetical protein BOW32_06140 [Solemya velum gill symbiont]